MITTSNPFLRNDYYPDQNDIDDLNTRINEVQSDVDLLAISVNEKTEAVNGRLNTLQNDYNESFETDALKANTADLNVLNVNVQATIKDLNAVNTYIENLIVNKPVQDLSLRTPHLENTTSLNGNFYAPNIIGGVFDNIQIENMQNIKVANIEADEVKANIANLNVLNAMNIKADEVTTNKIDLNAVTANTADFNVLGVVNIRAEEVLANVADFNETIADMAGFIDLKAVNIRADKVRANIIADLNAVQANTIDLNILNAMDIGVDKVTANTVNLNVVKANIADLSILNAVNIKTDEVTANTVNFNAVTANIADLKDLNAVNIQVDEVKANIINFNVLNAANIEADEVKANKLIGDFFSAKPITSSAVVGYDENGQLIPIRASYDVSFPENADYLKTDAQGIARKGTPESEVVQSTNLIQAGAVQNMYDAVNANFNNVESNVKTINDFIFNGIYLPSYGSFNSSSPVNYTNATTVKLYGDAQGGTAIPGGGGMIKFDDSTNTVTFGFSSACKCITNARGMFLQCSSLNQNILIPNSVENARCMFDTCTNLNQNILIPNSVKDTVSMFIACSSLNQNILIPNSAIDVRSMFALCPNFDQNILIPNSVKYTDSLFMQCPNFNQNILIPNSVTHARSMFMQCSSLNQDIYIYSQVLRDMTDMFKLTQVNKHNVHIPSSVPKDTSNSIYNCLVNGRTGVTFAPENIINDLPVDPVIWPPIG